ncbi:MAG: nicotinamide riboside transporter PnuC [Flavobacteriales bacterium Tduv]
MNEWFNFLLMPYNQTSISAIILEAIAFLFGIIAVIFSQRVNIWTYPMGIVSTSIYIYLTFAVALYADMMINIYYTSISFYGWHIWERKKDETQTLHITFSDRKDYLKSGVLFIATVIVTVIIYSINRRLEQGYAWIDIFTTGIFFSGMYQMAMKKVENWIFWIVGNIVSIPLYFYKGLVLTSIQFIIFTGLSIGGYILWKRKAKEKDLRPLC